MNEMTEVAQEDTKVILNDLFVDIFNQVLALEKKIFEKDKNFRDISMTETHVLEAIRKCDPPTMGTIAAKLQITPGTLTSSVNKLIDKGYVNRHRSEVDRRIVTLSLTAKGESVFQLHEEFHRDLVEAAVADLENREDLKRALQSMHRFFQKIKEKY
ncbi:MAG: MarR family winged helix-turn-helix transcriptional regulator [Turicibacter sp.]|nr:MarR family winged helix-turn-helix transcriptional regulator [Turicibacter sp.]